MYKQTAISYLNNDATTPFTRLAVYSKFWRGFSKPTNEGTNSFPKSVDKWSSYRQHVRSRAYLANGVTFCSAKVQTIFWVLTHLSLFYDWLSATMKQYHPPKRGNNLPVLLCRSQRLLPRRLLYQFIMRRMYKSRLRRLCQLLGTRWIFQFLAKKRIYQALQRRYNL